MDLSRRKPEILTLSRAGSVTEENINAFFTLYEGALQKHNLMDKPHLIFNLDETGLSTDRKNESIYAPRGCKNAYLIAPNEGKSLYSVLFCISAAGRYLPPFVVYKSKHLYDTWTKGGPLGAMYSCSDSGWMMDFNFENWFCNGFVKQVSDLEKPLLLTFDGHNSHLTYNVVKTAIDNNIILLCLPPNSSHALQPLDVGIFRAVKRHWKKILNSWYCESRMQSVDKAVFPILLRRLWQVLNPVHAVNAFRGSGLYPIDKSPVLKRVVKKPKQVQKRTEGSSTDSPEHSIPDTPRKLLREAIANVISPNPSHETQEALLQKRKKRSRVQAQIGEILTEECVMKRLQEEERVRNEKRELKKNKVGAKKSKKSEGKSAKIVSVIRRLSYTSSESEVSISDDLLIEKEKRRKIKTSDLEEGKTFVIVVYEGSYFPGKVIKIGKCGTKVSCMSKSGPSVWKWPNHEDLHDYPIDDIIEVIAPPATCGTRGQCSVPEVEKYWKIF